MEYGLEDFSVYQPTPTMFQEESTAIVPATAVFDSLKQQLYSESSIDGQSAISNEISPQKKKRKRGNSASLQCDTCGKEFEKVESCYQHHRWAHPDEKIKCPVYTCHQTFDSKEKLKDHENKAHKRVQCSLCGKSYSKKVYLKRHVMRDHPNTDEMMTN